MRLLTLLILPALAVSVRGAESLSFDRDVRPILSDKCFHCHGPDENTREAKLRLDNREGALKNNAIVPGDPDASEVFYRITTDDDIDLMPPEKMHKPLTDAEIKTLKRWIEEGAEYENQWIYELPVKSEVPKVGGESPNHPIDGFIQDRLSREGRSPAPEAERKRLIRRLTFDLTGLPPTPAEVEAFVKDESPDAYEKVVDRLLTSPAHGERMAVYWLDLVRYADTVGFHGDQNVSQSPYRDYVINAFNDNMPFDRFTKEQLAGDLLPNPTLQQQVASGYNRLNMTTEEGGAQPKEYLAKYSGDRVRNTSVVWLGATLGCAECHDHKFDPYTMRDFYTFAAFFADLEEVGKYSARQRPPEIPVPDPEQAAELAGLELALQRAEEAAQTETPVIIATRDKWIADKRGLLKGELKPAATDVLMIRDQVAEGDKPSGDWKFIGEEEGPAHEGGQSRVQESDGLVQHILGLGRDRVASGHEHFFTMVHLDLNRVPETIMLQVRTNGKWEHRAYWGKDKIPYGGIGKESPAHHHMGQLPKPGQWVRLEVRAADIGIKDGDKIDGIAFTQHAGKAWWHQAGYRSVDDGSDLPAPVRKAILSDAPTKEQLDTLATHFRSVTPLLERQRQELAVATGKRDQLLASLPTMPISRAVEPRMIRVLPRGNWMDESGEVVEPAIPAFLGSLETAEGSDRLTRLDLADWITSRDNPMTARVFSNHLWHLFFGTGISNVLSDLGNQGEPPVHPELLDWLAVEFMESGWDVRHMIRLMITSHSYRQTSSPPEDLAEFDPYNRLVSVQSRRRLSAEMVRDNALKISGLLNPTIGGRSVFPYQPAGYYAQLNFPKREYQPSKDENQYRRAVYTHWQRTFLHPALMAFDAPSREACTAKRPVSNTPLQALVLMNDPSYVEAARHFGQRIMNEGGLLPEERLNWAFREALSRSPKPEESKVLIEVYQKHLNEYSQNPDDAAALTGIGLTPAETNEKAELAAWTSVSRVILNLHELITRL